MNRENYDECVYRLVKICEVTKNQKGDLTQRLNSLQYDTANKISERIVKRKDFYFDTILSSLKEKYSNNVQLKEDDVDQEVRREYKEGPIVVFPQLEVKVDQDTYINRNCNTVCMGENRSKLWIRLLMNGKKKNPETVKRFYANAEGLTNCIGDAVFKCYKSILAEENYKVKDVYSINVAGAASIEKKVGDALKELDNPNTTVKDLFDKKSALFTSFCDVIFPYFQMGDQLPDSESCSLAKFEECDWVSVIDPITKGRSIFLSSDTNEQKTTFVGFGYNPSVPGASVIQKATKDILTLISPNI